MLAHVSSAMTLYLTRREVNAIMAEEVQQLFDWGTLRNNLVALEMKWFDPKWLRANFYFAHKAALQLQDRTTQT